MDVTPSKIPAIAGAMCASAAIAPAENTPKTVKATRKNKKIIKANKLT